MPRGRLVFPFLVDLARLDTVAMMGDPDNGGPLSRGYDRDFREPVATNPIPGTSTAPEVRRKETLVQLPAQLEPDFFERLQMMATGRNAQSSFALVFHFRDLEAAGMVETSSGRPKLRAPGDRMCAIRNVKTKELIEEVPAKPGLYATQVQSRGFGLGPNRNLLLVTFEQRDVAVQGAP